jgi:Uma2 family endonuclease
MSTATIPTGQRLVLDGVSWRMYERLLRAFDERHVRMTYDRGALEIMTLSPEHERYKHLLRRLVEALIDELSWNIAGFGSMTFKRRKRRRGLESDECFWITNEPLIRGKVHIDLRHDPPPDLALEIDVTHSSLDRLGIYAALRVPEVWRYDGQDLHVHLLGTDGKYTESGQSRVFPFLPVAEVARFLGMLATLSETELLRQFRAWVRDRIAAGWQ